MSETEDMLDINSFLQFVFQIPTTSNAFIATAQHIIELRNVSNPSSYEGMVSCLRFHMETTDCGSCNLIATLGTSDGRRDVSGPYVVSVIYTKPQIRK